MLERLDAARVIDVKVVWRRTLLRRARKFGLVIERHGGADVALLCGTNAATLERAASALRKGVGEEGVRG